LTPPLAGDTAETQGDKACGTRIAGPSRITGRELALAALAGCLLAALMHWPLPLHLGRDVPRDIGDPLVQAWQVAWGGHALAHQPLDYFQANTFWPLRNSLAFSDALAGYAPAGLAGTGPHAAIVRYDLLFLFAYALAFFGAYLLARELGLMPWAAAVAGAAFAYAPWRLEQDGHLHVLSSGGIPLALFLLLRGYREGRAGVFFAGWLVATWQLSLGFTLGLQLAYLLAVLGAIAIAVLVRRRLRLERAIVAATVAGLTVFSLSAVLLARPYLEVADHHPEAKRSEAQISGLSGPVESFVAAPEENLVWGKATEGVRDRLSSVPEQALFPGTVIVALALAGLTGSVFSRRLRLGLGVGVIVLAFLSLGFHEHGAGSFYPYRLLYEFAPGWEGIRVPGRLMTLTSLGLALLAAAGAQRLAGGLATRAPRRAPHRVAWALGALLAVAVLVEGSGFDFGGGVAGPAHPAVPVAPKGVAGLSEPQLHLPLTIPANRRYVLWSTEGFPKLMNGRGSFVPLSFASLERRMRTFPDRRTAALLRSLGIRTVVLHPDLAPGTAWQGAAARPVAGLGLARRRSGDVLVYGVASPR
jgi:hypothetical protein